MYTHTKQMPARVKRIASAVLTLMLFAAVPGNALAASTWNPTLLVNTEAFQIIDDGDGSTNIELRFGESANEILRWDVTNGVFIFTDDLTVQGNLDATGNLSASGTLSVESTSSLQGNVTVTGTVDTTGNITTDADIRINDDSGAADAVLTFGNDGGDENLTFSDTFNQFSLSDDLRVGGGLSVSGSLAVEAGNTIALNGIAYSFPNADGAASGNTLKTDGAGTLTWSTDDDVPESGDFGNAGDLDADGTITDGVIDKADLSVSTDFGDVSTDGSSNITLDNDVVDSAEIATDAVQVAELDDGTDTASNDDVVMIDNSDNTQFIYIDIPNCTDSGGQHLNYSTASQAFSCGTTGDGGGGGSLTGTGNVNTLAFFTTANSLSGTHITMVNDDFLSGPTIHASTTLSSSGSVIADGNLTINNDADSNNAVVTFGSDTTNETLTWLNTQDIFQFSDDLNVTGAFSASGAVSLESTLNVQGAATFGSTTTLGGVAYTWPSSQGGSGTILTTDGSGNLSWTSGTTSSGSIVSLHPEYPGAIYFSSGSTFVGQLTASGGTASYENVYHWSSTNVSIQDYWVSARIRIPDTFANWDPVAPIQLRYRTANGTAATNHVKLVLRDTADALVSLTGNEGLANASFTTASITGPESSGTYTPGDYITIYVKLATTSSGWAEAGYINLNWETRN